MSGIFNSAIFNNSVFNTGAVVPPADVVIKGAGPGWPLRLEDPRPKKWAREKAVAGERREEIRALLRSAYGLAEPLPAPVAKEVREIAEPYVDKEAGRLRIDWKALNSSVSALQELTTYLSLEARARAEQDDEEVILLWH